MDAPDEIDRLRSAGARAEDVLGAILEEHRPRLERMVRFRMDPRLRQRIGVSDVLQEAFVEAAQRIPGYLEEPKMPFFLWLRFITAQRLLMLRRKHVGAQKRDVRKQVPLRAQRFPGASSVVLADALIASDTTPTHAVAREEMRAQLARALEEMRPADREVLVLRHFEGLTNAETAAELGIEKKAASKRYLRALERIRVILEDGEPRA